eukprot:CAMPEP_0185031642 /NCGR_PEP_ID=MMETSP1103-20130426/19224_1 /TAXON_ID=36769 /ORGANISM="Paraphysomonas bandaiensis, Strain Caron Lab Isolate" /LENGTH=602 /DNA_ID=CAMNT_0027567223 /DNA_START=94 /DNA_END=1899 /DNA_ORIENTATION=+
MESESISEHIRVYCRLRPELPEDPSSGFSEREGEGEFYLTGGASEGGAAITASSEDGACTYFSSTSKREHKFKVDGFFGPDTSQSKIYDTAVRPIVESALRGYSGTVFAYGPTGSGKTYTMMGEGLEVNKGIVPRVFDQLLEACVASRGLVSITMSYLQIYCETVSDLLDTRTSNMAGALSIREKNGTVYVENLSESGVSCYSDAADLISRGNANRATAATNRNASSSRSHAAILIRVRTPDSPDGKAQIDGKAGANGEAVRESTLVLVDLAGSERASAVAGRSYLRAEESKSINLSLSALGNCIAALSSQGADRAKHVPYRDSKLTRLLQGSLGGGARTAVVVNLPPGNDSSGEVLNALRFASRCAMVTVVAKVHRAVDYESLFAKLQQRYDEQEQRERDQQMDIEKQYEQMEAQEATIESLREEVAVLRRQLSAGVDAEKNRSDETKWAERLDTITAEHLKEMTEARQRNEQRVAAYKRSAADAAQEISSLQRELQNERERHLEAVKDVNLVNERCAESERGFEVRIQELLEEKEDRSRRIQELEQSVSDLKTQVSEKNEVISFLELKLQSMASGEGGDMVSRAQVEEMEAIFEDTINRL